MSIADENCQACGKPIEADGYCMTFGKFRDRWLCDACIELEVDDLENDTPQEDD
jgi:hypothetical protein